MKHGSILSSALCNVHMNDPSISINQSGIGQHSGTTLISNLH